MHAAPRVCYNIDSTLNRSKYSLTKLS